MNILHVAAEFFPLVKTGGLADVVGALPKAQGEAFPRSDIRILLPGFPAILDGLTDLTKIEEQNSFAGNFVLLLGTFEGQKVYVIKADHLYHRDGSPYHNANLEPYQDNYLRFALLGWVAAELAAGHLDMYYKAEIVQAHDWHAGLTAAYLVALNKPALCVFTVHNLAYQGVFPIHHFNELHLPNHFCQMNGLEFYGHISFLKAGLFYADHITTVSPTYAEEVTHFDSAFGLHGLLQEKKKNKKLTGILNGVDENIWNPLTDKYIAAKFDVIDTAGKQTCKIELQKKMGLPQNHLQLLFTVVSRLTEQKGLDWVLEVLPKIVEEDGQLVLLGSGDKWMQDAFLEAAKKYPKNIAVHIGHSDLLSHQFLAGADVVLVPSRFEPCGLTQLYALKYGTLPLVRATGGLADTVIDCDNDHLSDETATGFSYHGHDAKSLEHTIMRAFNLWDRPEIWENVQTAAMEQDYRWEQAANQYFKLYRNLF